MRYILAVPLLLMLITARAATFTTSDQQAIAISSREDIELSNTEASFSIPSISIKAGIYNFVADPKIYWHPQIGFGFLVSSNKFQYVSGTDWMADVNYGLSGNYVIVEGSGFGSAAGHNHLMVLCQFDKSTVKYLDAIAESQYMDFSSVTTNAHQSYFDKSPPDPAWIDIKDISHNGIPEIKLDITYEGYSLYVAIIDGHLKVDLNPMLYTPLFEKEAQKVAASKRKSNAYYYYGFLSKKLDLNEIKVELKHATGRAAGIVDTLEHVNDWDAAFRRDLKPLSMMQIDLVMKP